MMTYAPFARAMVAAGRSEFEKAYTYQDYLYEMCAAGHSQNPISEQQWDMICDTIGSRKLMYASNIKSALNLVEKK